MQPSRHSLSCKQSEEPALTDHEDVELSLGLSLGRSEAGIIKKDEKSENILTNSRVDNAQNDLQQQQRMNRSHRRQEARKKRRIVVQENKQQRKAKSLLIASPDAEAKVSTGVRNFQEAVWSKELCNRVDNDGEVEIETTPQKQNQRTNFAVPVASHASWAPQFQSSSLLRSSSLDRFHASQVGLLRTLSDSRQRLRECRVLNRTESSAFKRPNSSEYSPVPKIEYSTMRHEELVKKIKEEEAASSSASSSCEQREFPWVSTSVNGKTIGGVLYRYKNGEVKIMCACHGDYMSARGFVEHAGATEIAHPERNIVVSPFILSTY